MIMLALMEQAAQAGPMSWLGAIGGVSGIGALATIVFFAGRWAARMDAVEKDIEGRPRKAEIDATMKALGKAIDAVRDDVRGIREDLRELLLGRRK